MDRFRTVTAFVDRFIEMAFVWGPGTDCAGRVLWYLAQCDRLPEAWIGADDHPRTDTKTARAVLRRYGGATFAKVVSTQFDTIAPLNAITGDLAAVPEADPRDPAVGVVLGALVYVPSPCGLTEKPLTEACGAWRVPL